MAEGKTDLVGLGRALLADMGWLAKSRQGKNPKACIDCYGCLKRVVLEKALACVRWPDWRIQRVDFEHQLLSRGMYRGLLVATDQNDLELYRRQLPAIMPCRHGLSATVLFLQQGPEPAGRGQLEQEFAGWLRGQWEERGYVGGHLDFAVLGAREVLDQQVRREVEAGGYGMVMVCRRPSQVWRARLLYQMRGRTAVLLGANPKPLKVLVALDLSPVSLLVLHLVRHAVLCQPGAEVRLVHVLSGPEEQAKTDLAGLSPGPGVGMRRSIWRCCPRKKMWPGALLALAEEGGYGRVAMGQRGLSGVKRWLLGSVSAGVLRGLTDQSLVLVD